MLLEEMTWKEIEKAMKKTRTIILPVGATEEHGPHLPTCTDSLQAYEIAKIAGEQKRVFVAPLISYGVCRSTRDFVGTITIRPQTLKLLIEDILLSLSGQGFENIVIFTGHAGSMHVASIREACEEVAREVEAKIAIVSFFDLIRNAEIIESKNDGHAGEVETSAMLLLRGKLVRGKAKANYPARPKHLVLKSMKKILGSGVMGDPTRASKAKGKKLVEIAVKGLIEGIEETESYIL